MLEEFLVMSRAAGKSDATVNRYRIHLNRFNEWLRLRKGCATLMEVTSNDIAEYRHFLSDEWNLKPDSVNASLSILNVFFKWMRDEGYIKHDPAAKVDRVQTVRERPRWLDASERYRVIRTALADENPRNTAIILTLVLSGLTVSELCGLTPDDVVISDQKGSIRVRYGKRRLVPMGKDLRRVLGEYVVQGRSGSQWLFASQRAEQLTPKGVQHICADIGDKAHVRGLTPYVLRHTFAHDLLTRGVNLQTVAALMGISKLDQLRVYMDNIEPVEATN